MLPPEFYVRELMFPRYWRRDGSPYPAGHSGLLAWSRDWKCHGLRCVDESWTPWGDHVSTVWLGLDHNFSPTGRPVIFETMVFDRNGGDILCDRYCTELEALDGHRRAYMRALIPPPLVRFLQKHFGQR